MDPPFHWTGNVKFHSRLLEGIFPFMRWPHELCMSSFWGLISSLKMNVMGFWSQQILLRDQWVHLRQRNSETDVRYAYVTQDCCIPPGSQVEVPVEISRPTWRANSDCWAMHVDCQKAHAGVYVVSSSVLIGCSCMSHDGIAYRRRVSSRVRYNRSQTHKHISKTCVYCWCS